MSFVTPTQMPEMVAFFPWVSVAEPIVLGRSARLLPFRLGVSPGDRPHVTQHDLDGILSAYSNRPNVPVANATILEVDDWQAGQDATRVMHRLFKARTSISFAALTKRRLFASHMDYCNHDTYSLVVQRYGAGKTGIFSFPTRRRDGGTSHMWGSDEFAFQRPLHVDIRARMMFDEKLAQTLMELPTAASGQLFEALSEFNSANTDSGDVPVHVEVVMMKSAFEWLLNINQDAMNFVKALDTRLNTLDRDTTSDGPLGPAWKARFPKAKRPLGAWAQEFCDLRGAAAHGSERKASRFVWSTMAHLAFATTLFPLLVKKQLADSGNGLLSALDAAKLQNIEAYLMHDPFAYDPISQRTSNPWVELDMQALIDANARKFYGSKPEL